MSLSAGTVLDNYKLLARVGAGSCGSVWQAENIVSGELYALKVLFDNELAERELRALKLFRELTHPALIRIRHIGQFENTFFYTMDWCESSLAERKVSPKELVEIARKLTEGLALLHSHGLLHRDIKPANIFFRQGAPVLGDIGLLTRQEGATFAGSPGFLAPAILSGKSSADRYSDCYALAKSIYCALSGLGPEQFPLYTGEMSSEASLLMRAVMAVCSEKPSVHNTEDFLSLLSPQPQKEKKHILFWTIFIACILAGLCICFYFFRSDKKIVQKKQGTLAESPQQKSPAPNRIIQGKMPTPATHEQQKIVTSQNKETTRAEILKKWQALPPEAEKKKQETLAESPQQKSPAPNRIIQGKMPTPAIHEQQKTVTSQNKETTRAEILKKWQALPPEAEKKKQALNDSRKVYSIIGLSGRGRMTAWPQKEESLFLSKLSEQQQKEYLKWCAAIREIESTSKWKKISKTWWSADYGSQVRKVESEKGLSTMEALRLLAEKDPILALLVMQGECHLIRDTMIRDASWKKDSDFPCMYETFVSKASEYSSAFYRLKLTNHQ